MPSRQEKIVIVGGGLVGALLAVMLGHRGFQVTVYEKRPDMRKTVIPAGRSINLALAERGFAALRTAGLLADVESMLIPMRGRMLHPLNGPCESFAYGQRPREVIYSVSRSGLNQVMLTDAENTENVKFHFDHECVGVDLAGQVATIRDHRRGVECQVTYDVLLATDGANSVVRDQLVKAAGGQWHTDWLDHDYKELSIPSGPSGEFLIDQNSLHIWPRHGFMLIALPNIGGSFTVTLFLNKEGSPSFQRLDHREAVVHFFQEQFPDALALIPDLATDFFENPTGVLGTVRCSRWTNGQNALLLGDAAHAIVPFHGQGMNAGFEDCQELMNCLDASPEDWTTVFKRFESLRIENANAIADMALENYVTMRDSVLDPHFQLKKELGFILERRNPSRFIPQYSMIMFHRIPYAEAKLRGALQDQILESLLQGHASVESIDLSEADRIVLERLQPIALVHLG